MRFLAAATLFAAFMLTADGAAFADPADDINVAIKAFAALKSVHVDITAAAGSATEDMVNPSKSKETYSFMGREIQIVKIGPDRWINVTGQWRKAHSSTSASPIDSQIDMANSLVLEQKDVRGSYTVSDGGSVTIGTVSAHKYHLADKDSSSRQGDVFIGPGQLPLRIVIDSTSGPITYTYSNYNNVADISAPI